MPGADPSMLGSHGQLGAPGQLGQPSQLALPGAVPPQHMQHGPPGFPHPAGPPQTPPDFDKQHLGTARPVFTPAFNHRRSTVKSIKVHAPSNSR